MTRAGALTLPLALLLAACVPSPDTYPAPPQHAPIVGKTGAGSGEYTTAADPSADTYIIKDVQPLESGSWRWTHAEPEFRFFLKRTEKRMFRLDLSAHEVTMRDTGPLELDIVVNGTSIGRVTYDTPGDKRFEKAVPESLLKANQETRVVVRVLNPWNAPDPGVKLGFLLRAVGFVN